MSNNEVRIEYVKLSEVASANRNPKLHDIQAIANSIRRYGFVAPLIENAATGRIVAGHGRAEALATIHADTPNEPPARIKVTKAGDWLIPVVRGVSFESEEAAEEYLLADNRLSEIGGWNLPQLGPILDEIAARNPGTLGSLGWSDFDIQALIGSPPEPGESPVEFPEVSPGNVTIQYCCPKCQYKWSGSPDPAKRLEPEATEE
jgi:hypothetical protein